MKLIIYWLYPFITMGNSKKNKIKFFKIFFSEKAKKIVANKSQYIKDDPNLNNLIKILKEIEPLKEEGNKKFV